MHVNYIAWNFLGFGSLPFSDTMLRVIFYAFKLHAIISYIQNLICIQTSTCVSNLNLRMRKKLEMWRCWYLQKYASYKKDSK
jgi:hypothetical protein